MDDLRYPIGAFEAGPPPDLNMRTNLLSQLSDAPDRLRAAVSGLSESQLETPYRPGGWTVRQVVHHLADAYMNWYIRTKLALTEDAPAIRTYDEARWAKLNDARTAPLDHSMTLIEGLTRRWAMLFDSLSKQEWKRSIVHPERGTMTLDSILPLIVWHAKHHTAHITSLRTRMGWLKTG